MEQEAVAPHHSHLSPPLPPLQSRNIPHLDSPPSSLIPSRQVLFLSVQSRQAPDSAPSSPLPSHPLLSCPARPYPALLSPAFPCPLLPFPPLPSCPPLLCHRHSLPCCALPDHAVPCPALLYTATPFPHSALNTNRIQIEGTCIYTECIQNTDIKHIGTPTQNTPEKHFSFLI